VRHVLESAVVSLQRAHSARGVSAAIGLATLLFSASGALVELDASLNRIWGDSVKKEKGLWQLTSLVFAALFRYVPRSRPAFRDVIGGAVLTTTALAILKLLLASSLSRLTSYSAYGVAGGVLAVAMWIYLSTQVLFFGACLTRATCLTCEGPTHDMGLEA
jgi:uncharacterized BrkB/YihY/UPF0761 family membrane protein